MIAFIALFRCARSICWIRALVTPCLLAALLSDMRGPLGSMVSWTTSLFRFVFGRMGYFIAFSSVYSGNYYTGS